MTDLLKDILDTLNSLPNRKVKGKDFTTYELAKRVEQEIEFWEKNSSAIIEVVYEIKESK